MLLNVRRSPNEILEDFDKATSQNIFLMFKKSILTTILLMALALGLAAFIHTYSPFFIMLSLLLYVVIGWNYKKLHTNIRKYKQSFNQQVIQEIVNINTDIKYVFLKSLDDK